METTKPKRVKIVRKPSIGETLKMLEIGRATLFTIRDWKTQAARVAASELKKKGYDFTITEEGMVDEYIVTRLK